MTSKRQANSWVETSPNDGSGNASNDGSGNAGNDGAEKAMGESSKTKRVRGSNITKADKTLFMGLLKFHDPNGILFGQGRTTKVKKDREDIWVKFLR
jgi:hypothetical protein